MIYENKIVDFLTNADRYHAQCYQKMTFNDPNDPSLYFHRKALTSNTENISTSQLEYIYAVLPLWGMHRIGKGGPKMLDFEVFQQSVMRVEQDILTARKANHLNMSESDWTLLEKIFKTLKIMASGTSLVGNSKVMAHLLPNIIPPIDRKYTLKYLCGNADIKNDIGTEWSMMKTIIQNFFIPVARDEAFQKKANAWMANQTQYPWDTSLFKVIDNVIIGAAPQTEDTTRNKHVRHAPTALKFAARKFR